MYFIFFFIYLISFFYRIKEKIDCSICEKYTIDLKNPHWFMWFECQCFDIEKRKKDPEIKKICFHYDTLLDIHIENFWEEWVRCKCIYEDFNSFREEL